MFLVLSLFFSAVYLFVICILYRGLRSLHTYNENGNYTFSIIIAARNEEAVLRSCLDSVLHQSIPSDRYEVILIDDRSTDKTLDIANEYASLHPNMIVKHIDTISGKISPKKNAVSVGVAMASNEIIVFTDADCIVQKKWLETINQTFDKDTGLVQGITRYSEVNDMNSFFWGLQSVDFLSHGIVAASAIGAGIPLNSNANNFAFRRQAFSEIGGYGHSASTVVSGDDDLLLQRIWRQKKWKIRYMTNESGIVTTLPTKTLKGVFEQRKRWGSKTIHYNPLQVLMLSGIFLFYLAIASALCIGIFIPSYLMLGMGMIILKFAGEAALMIPGIRIFGQNQLKRFIFPASIIQLPLVIGAVVFGIFGKFSWKDQMFSRKV